MFPPSSLRQFLLSISYVEIYEDRVRDLLFDASSCEAVGFNPNDLAVREDEEGRTFVEGVELIPVTHEEQIYSKKEVFTGGFIFGRTKRSELTREQTSILSSPLF